MLTQGLKTIIDTLATENEQLKKANIPAATAPAASPGTSPIGSSPDNNSSHNFSGNGPSSTHSPWPKQSTSSGVNGIAASSSPLSHQQSQPPAPPAASVNLPSRGVPPPAASVLPFFPVPAAKGMQNGSTTHQHLPPPPAAAHFAPLPFPAMPLPQHTAATVPAAATVPLSDALLSAPPFRARPSFLPPLPTQ